MKFIIFLLLPWLSGGCALLLARLQWAQPLLFPWPLLAALAIHLCATVWIGWRRLSVREAVEKMLPSVLAMAAFGLSLLLLEGAIARYTVTILFAGVSLLSLKLFFLLCWDPQRYPVNALSHVNVALVPLIAFFLGLSLNGLTIFVRLPWWAGVSVFGVTVAALYLVTSHPTADAAHRARWTALGLFVGIQSAILTQVLPGNMLVQGALAALLVALPLRMRRYAYEPKPSRRVAWFEGVLGAGAYMAILLLSRWA